MMLQLVYILIHIKKRKKLGISSLKAVIQCDELILMTSWFRNFENSDVYKTQSKL